MSPDSPLFGRITIGSARHSLGRANIGTLLIRAAEQIRQAKHRADMVIQIELSPTKLPDATTFDKAKLMEQQLASQIQTDLTEPSPFDGISMERVTEAMGSPEYSAYAAICEPTNRIGLSRELIEQVKDAYRTGFPDCFPHFPKFIDS